MRKRNNKLVFGCGINDVDYNVFKTETVDGKKKTTWFCPYYRKWFLILERCYSSNLHKRRPNYIGCSVHPDWLYFSNFIKWVDSQPNRDWVNCVPDKDILIVGNKIYSPDTVAFVTPALNNFVLDRSNFRGNYMLGVCLNKTNGKFVSQCGNPFGKTNYEKKGFIGYFDTELEAHLAWKEKKREYAFKLSELQTDERVAKALRERYL